ncbi:biopolymer transporter ExbD [Helicobacter sp. 11S02629-2]|uniref:ExbD/TolR family protein n=1 Tax=Helicobacter sp. 11S02629-2 TaxID=1476195 RepID=UPI000BA55C38|nr:biopolymer transporter ExbD [Helicobacter sp. 11S02629-2]PAF45453.1 hypothetical protein BKH40_03015 [Helicobacter sp. 11S02629-2]
MKKIDSLNLVPFIDIMLVLLVIVLTSASFVQHPKVSLNVPKVDAKASSSATSNDKSFTISIDKKGKIYANDKEVDVNALKASLSNLDKSTNIILNTDKDGSVENFMQVVSVLKDLELSKVYVSVDDK